MTRFLKRWLPALCLGLGGLPIAATQAQTPKPVMIQTNQPAPDFAATTADGQPFQLRDLRGRRVLLSFMRNVGCPICNLRVHELRQKADSLRAANTTVVLIYESPNERLREYLAGEALPFTFIGDPALRLYEQYGVEKSVGKMLRTAFNGGMAKAKAGQALFKQKFAQDGNASRIEADFLIDERGTVERAHYGRFVGDHLPL